MELRQKALTDFCPSGRIYAVPPDIILNGKPVLSLSGNEEKSAEITRREKAVSSQRLRDYFTQNGRPSHSKHGSLRVRKPGYSFPSQPLKQDNPMKPREAAGAGKGMYRFQPWRSV